MMNKRSVFVDEFRDMMTNW